MLAAFLGLVTAALLGCVGLVQLARGRGVLPRRPRQLRQPSRGNGGDLRLAMIALLAGTVVGILTRWPVAAVVTAAVVFIWPKIGGAGPRERADVAKLEAVAAWTEALRDTSSAAAGLEHAIPATVEGAPKLLERPLRNLVHALSARVPLPEALTLFADDVDDVGADRVVGALSLNARQRAGSLSRVLSVLADNTRRELEVRRKVLHERNRVRRSAQQVAGIILVLAGMQAVFFRGWVAPYSTATGQIVLAVLAAAYLGLVMRLRKLAEPEPQPRFLGSAERVTEMASYQPRLVTR